MKTYKDYFCIEDALKEHQNRKKKFPDIIIFIEIDGHYATFAEDVKKCKQILGDDITVSFTHEALKGVSCVLVGMYDAYIVKLVKAGYQIAVCSKQAEQQELTTQRK